MISILPLSPRKRVVVELSVLRLLEVAASDVVAAVITARFSGSTLSQTRVASKTTLLATLTTPARTDDSKKHLGTQKQIEVVEWDTAEGLGVTGRAWV